MELDIKVPENIILQPIITVFGVGGAGGNAVNNMIRSNLKGANFVVANTDAQALKFSESKNTVQLGAASTKGLGAGANPEVGRQAAMESESEIRAQLEGSNMVFITAGMGGGTGTGASAVIAGIAKELGILTVGVVTKPFLFEGAKRMKLAEQGLQELQKNVDTLIVIPNQNLFRVANENTTFQQAFEMADEVLHAGVRGVTDLITSPGLVNLDFADIETVMSEKGKAMMGTGESSGEDRAIKAAEAAISNPLLDQNSMYGACGVLINITGGKDMTLYEVDSAANRIREEVGDSEANIIFGSTFNPDLEGKIRVSVVATGIDQDKIKQYEAEQALSQNTLSQNDIFDVQSPPEFNEYDGTQAEDEIEEIQPNIEELTKQMEFNGFNPGSNFGSHSNFDEFATTNENFYQNQPVQKPKQSLFKRMWNSLMSSEDEELTMQNNNFLKTKNLVNKKDDSSVIKEAPSFFKDKI